MRRGRLDRLRTALVLIMLAAPFAAPPAAADTFTVEASDFAWTPRTLAVDVGDTVSFVAVEGTHTWAQDDGLDSCALPCTRVFTEAASIGYHCSIHPFMTGILQVGPPMTLTVDTPAAGASVAGLVRVEGTVTTPSGEVSFVRARFEGGAFFSASVAGTAWWVDLPSEVHPDGPRRILVDAASTTGLTISLERHVTVDNPDRIDLHVTTVAAPPSATLSSTITYSVRNLGNVPSGVFTIRAEYFYQGEWRRIGDATLASLAGSASRTATITWSQGAAGVFAGQFTIRVVADPDARLVDVERANNARTGSAGWFTSLAPGVDMLDPV